MRGRCREEPGACLATPTALQIKSADGGVALTPGNGAVLTCASFPACSPPASVGNAPSASILRVRSSELEHVDQRWLIYLRDPPMTPGYRTARAKHGSRTKTRLIPVSDIKAVRFKGCGGAVSYTGQPRPRFCQKCTLMVITCHPPGGLVAKTAEERGEEGRARDCLNERWGAHLSRHLRV